MTGTPVSRVTIADVAIAAGVSKTAVSFAFNNPENLGQATLERVLRVARDLGYAPHPAARALSMRRSGTMGVLIPQRLSTVFANPFLSELMQGLGEQCEEHDLTLLLVPPLDGSLESAIRQASVDGFISLGGHTQLAIIVLPPTRSQLETTPTAARRMAGYEAAIAGAGAPAPECVTAGISVEAGARAFHQLREGVRRPTAVLAMSDMAAIGVMSAARASGLRVPADLSVVGFDDLPMAAWTYPPLTTVHQPIVEKGRLAARLLIDRMNGRKVESPQPLTTSLVVRGSTSKGKEVVGRQT